LLRAYPGLTDADLRRPRLLRSLATQVAGELRRSGTNIGQPRATSLSIGRAFRLDGTQPLGPSYGGASTGFTFYVFILGHTVYELEFRADSRLAAHYARLWPQIAAKMQRT